MNKTMKAIGLTAAIAVMIPLSAYAATNSTSTTTNTTNTTATQQQGKESGKFNVHFEQKVGFGGAVSQEVLDLLKLDAAALKEKLAAGKTLAQVAEEQGVSRDALKQALTTAFEKQQAAEKQAFSDNLDKLVDSDPGSMTDGRGGRGKGGGFGMEFQGKEGFHFENKTDINAAAAPVLGMSDVELNTVLQEGNNKSLADLATDRGVDVQKVIDAVKQAIINDLNASVKAGDLTQEQADKAIADAAKIAENTVNGKGSRVKMSGQFGFGNTDLSGAATALGLTADDLKTALASGKTLADVAKDKGVDVQKVIDAVKQTIVDGLNAAVTAGKLTQDQADKQIAKADELATNVVNGKLQRKFHIMEKHVKAGDTSAATSTSASTTNA
ncbi:hypothetical protein [Paenibacillus sp. OV219]|uniref:hypothetical protein n=1 Tax=Paenibacillus sp. OV219 TaxID=1884377 RepID=UPI0008CB3CD7|nr:hypothetical protein [Paenibacillus sp. OV219]SEO68745.1 hypothetical protein SAMN05518847_109243 [Paenibacillus sp. OV219]